MSKFEILCVTMNQTDFSKIKEMNIHSDVVFSNQADTTLYSEIKFENHTAKMITTNSKGVGINRNLGLSYASAEICLFADDDVKYVDNLEDIVVKEFDNYPKADVIIFHLNCKDNESRKQIKYKKTRKHRKIEKMPWGAFRIAFRRESVLKGNIWFSTLYGGGSIFPCGEDSIWLLDAKRNGLKFYVSKETIGDVSFEKSSWFSGFNEKYYYGKGAFYAKVHKNNFLFWAIYFSLRTSKMTKLNFIDRVKWIFKGKKGYRNLCSYEQYLKK